MPQLRPGEAGKGGGVSTLKTKRLPLPRVKADLPYMPMVCIDMARRPESLDEVAERVHRRSEVYAWAALATVAIVLLCIAAVLRALQYTT